MGRDIYIQLLLTLTYLPRLSIGILPRALPCLGVSLLSSTCLAVTLATSAYHSISPLAELLWGRTPVFIPVPSSVALSCFSGPAWLTFLVSACDSPVA